MLLKTGGAVLLALSGLGGGWLFARRLRLRRDFLTAFLTFLSQLATALRYRRDAVYTLVNSSGELFEIPPSDFTLPFAEAWDKQLHTLPAKWKLRARDMELLRDFGARLGTTDTQGQLEHIALYQALFQKQLAQAREDITQKARLYQALGLFIGVSAALTLL